MGDDAHDDDDRAGECCPDCKIGIEQGREELLATALVAAFKSPAFQRAMEIRQAKISSVGPIERPKVVRHAEEFECSGKKGDVVEIDSAALPFFFRGEDLRAEDTSGHDRGTKILEFHIGDRKQIPTMHYPFFWTESFKPSPLDCGLMWPTAHPGEILRFKIEFLEDCAWRAWFIGRKIGE